jgi:uncharacterized protein YdeI (YjbR/CyaY-like superfamily)
MEDHVDSDLFYFELIFIWIKPLHSNFSKNSVLVFSFDSYSQMGDVRRARLSRSIKILQMRGQSGEEAICSREAVAR